MVGRSFMFELLVHLSLNYLGFDSFKFELSAPLF